MSMKKLQAEIDRLLKKVSEGVETFENIFDKINYTSNANQKEKYEQDLKKEIKKLQRLRDQIKTWLSSNDIKDKRALLDNRKLIEAQMERFKQIEKEMKTKAYSKEGLLQKERLDPKDKEKADACEFVTNAVDELSRQIEHEEFEIEQLEGSKRGNKKTDHQRVERVLEMERLNERRKFHINRLELILRLLENDHLEPERVNEFKDAIQYYVECNQEPDFEEDEGLYDELDLEKEEELYAIRTDEFHNKSDDEADDEGDDGNEHGEVEPNAAKAATSRDASSTTFSSNYAQSMSPSVKSSDKGKVTFHLGKQRSLNESNVLVSAWNEPPKIGDQSKASSSSITSDKRALISSPYSTAASSTSEKDVKLPASLADLAPSFELVRNKSRADINYTNQMLNVSFQHVPDLIDSERPKVYQPRNPFSNPSYYPQQPLIIFDNPVLYEKFDMNTLFYIFYYQQGTYQQYLAAKELKKQSWRFHKKYLTWFQRHEEPKIITEDYEQGTYIYFDYEGAWCQRKKTEFRFEYRYLEEA
ncbi:hypothetical protein MBANPS3_007948 [Mucor bainieri]